MAKNSQTLLKVVLTIEQFDQLRAIVGLRAKEIFDESFYGNDGSPEYLASLVRLANALGNHTEIEG